jgi:hypothetical protein
MIDDGKPGGRGQLRNPVSVACCRWTPIDFAGMKAGQAATASAPERDQVIPRNAASADQTAELLKMP